jgi:prepilin-type processing-associated H-X9-DG protein
MKNRAAFTLTEMLVLASVGFLLVGAVLPSLDDAKQKLQASQCLSNMRQWGLAFAMYCNDHHDYIPYNGNANIPIDADVNLTAWFNVLPRYMNQTPLKDLYATNQIPIPGSRSVFVCPSAPAITYTPASGNAYFSYAMNRLMSGALSACPNNLYKRSIAALPGQVILLAESEDVDPWYPYTDGWYLGQNNPRHRGGDNFVFVDGHAEWEPLSVYRWPTNYGNNALIEWITPRQVYWFPCPTCDKTCITH